MAPRPAVPPRPPRLLRRGACALPPADDRSTRPQGPRTSPAASTTMTSAMPASRTRQPWAGRTPASAGGGCSQGREPQQAPEGPASTELPPQVALYANEPRSTTVSRYTCGSSPVSADAASTVGSSGVCRAASVSTPRGSHRAPGPESSVPDEEGRPCPADDRHRLAAVEGAVPVSRAAEGCGAGRYAAGAASALRTCSRGERAYGSTPQDSQPCRCHGQPRSQRAGNGTAARARLAA